MTARAPGSSQAQLSQETTASASRGSTGTMPTEDEEARRSLERLLARLMPVAPASAQRLRTLADVALAPDPNPADVASWSSVDLPGLFDPPTLAAAILDQRARRWAWAVSVAEFVRNFLVLVPVTLTWIGLGKAGAVYATCASTSTELSKVPFLLLWQKGFRDVVGVFCDLGAGTTTFGLLDSFGDVVKADSVVLLMVIGLTIFVHGFTNLRATANAAAAERIADELRSLLGFCATRLRRHAAQRDSAVIVLEASENLKVVAEHFQEQARKLMVESAQGATTLVLEASENLRVVATTFREEAQVMLAALKERSADAEARLTEIGARSVGMAEKALVATNQLQRSLEIAAGTAHELALVSGQIRADMADSASSIRDAVAVSHGQLTAVGTQLDSVAGALAGVDRTIGRLVTATTDASGIQVETRNDLRKMPTWLAPLTSILEEIARLRMDVRSSGASRIVGTPARTQTVLQVAQLGVTVMLVLGIGVLIVRSERPTESTPGSRTPLVAPPADASAQPTFELPSGDAADPLRGRTGPR